MMERLKLLALMLPLLLWGCVITPGKFVSTLDIRADRSFAFTYAGEVWALDLGDQFKGLADDKDEATPAVTPAAWQDTADETAKKARAQAELERKRAAIAVALAKEAGYRKVAYLGQGRFAIDYAISGTLTHGFVYPFNVDAEAVFPFIAIELRGKDGIRMKAPAFAGGSGTKGMPGTEGFGDKLDGTFTLTTDAEIVSQNTEDGPAAGPRGKTVTWKASPLTKDAPMAVLKVAALP